MRGTDWAVYSDGVGELRLGLLLHILELCKLFCLRYVVGEFCRIGGLDMLTSYIYIYIYIYGGNVLCLDRRSFKKLLSKRVDYSFLFYMEVYQFVYCLLSRTRKISSLPDLHNWEVYMDMEKVDEFDSISPVDFLRDHSGRLYMVVMTGVGELSASSVENSWTDWWTLFWVSNL